MIDKEMEAILSEGGISDDGMSVDPVSGNEIPPGSMAEEVRDDIPAQLSNGEYVVPADVVRYFGVNYFEKLRMKAKAGLEEMESDGRIGGSSSDDMEDDEGLGMMPDEMSEEDMIMLEQMASGEMEMSAGGMVLSKALGNLGYKPSNYAQGGLTSYPENNLAEMQQVQGLNTFNPNDYRVPGLYTITGGSQGTGTPGQAQSSTMIYRGPNGEVLTVRMENGVPVDTIPPGYVPEAQYNGPAASPTAKAPSRERDSFRSPTQQRQEDPNQRVYAGVDFDNPLQAGADALGSITQPEGFVSQILTGGLLGRGVGAATDLASLSVARANLQYAQQRGLDTTDLERQIAEAEAKAGFDNSNIDENIASGRQRLESANAYFQRNNLNDPNAVIANAQAPAGQTPKPASNATAPTVSTSPTASRDRKDRKKEAVGGNTSSTLSPSSNVTTYGTTKGPQSGTTTPAASGPAGGPVSNSREDREAKDARDRAVAAAKRLGVTGATKGRYRGGLMKK